MIKNLKLILFFPFFLIEILLFKVFKIKNSELSHQALIHLFTITHGYSNNIISKFLSSPKSVFSNASNIFKKKTFLILTKNYHLMDTTCSKINYQKTL